MMALTNSDIYVDNTGDFRKFRLLNTWNGRETVEHMKELREAGVSGRSDDGSMRLMGEIPNEMWAYDPWLIEARKARNGGDNGRWQEMLCKFFEVHKELAMPFQKKYFTVRG